MANPRHERNWKLDFQKGVCIYCNKGNEEDIDCGKLLSDKDGKISVHNYCLLFASGLCQGGNDTEGIDGFLVPDILAEYRRAKRLRCIYCSQSRATIGCSVPSCKKGFHFNCGFKKEAMFLFFDTFLSLCKDHRPQQVAPISQPSTVICPICMDDVEAKVSNHTLKTPCCNNTWFHRNCVQRQALSSGYFFRCAICNNQDDFQKEMKQFGIYIPEHDASWEREDNAYQDLYWRHDSCDIDPCKCPEGRKFNEASSKWELVLCDLCGSYGCHLACGGLKSVNQDWACSMCSAMLSNATEVNCPTASSSQKSESSFVESPTRTGNGTRTAMKLMGKHPRTPLSAHSVRKKTTPSQLSPRNACDPSDFVSFDHCQPSTSKQGLQETETSPTRKRKLSFISKENAHKDAVGKDQHTVGRVVKKHSTWKTQPADFWHNQREVGTKMASGLTYRPRTTLRMSMRPRNIKVQCSPCPIPTKSLGNKNRKTTSKSAKKSYKTKRESSLIDSKIETYFPTIPRKQKTDLPTVSVKQKDDCASQGMLGSVSIENDMQQLNNSRVTQPQDKESIPNTLSIDSSDTFKEKSQSKEPSPVEKTKINGFQYPAISRQKNTSEQETMDVPAGHISSSVKEYENQPFKRSLAETKTHSSAQSSTSKNEDNSLADLGKFLADSRSFLSYLGDDENDDAYCQDRSPLRSGDSSGTDAAGEGNMPAPNADTVYGQPNSVITPYMSSVQGSNPRYPSLDWSVIPTAVEETQELQHTACPSHKHQDISANQTKDSLQNETTSEVLPTLVHFNDDVTRTCDLQHHTQLSDSQPDETLSSQVQSSQAGYATGQDESGSKASSGNPLGNAKPKAQRTRRKIA